MVPLENLCLKVIAQNAAMSFTRVEMTNSLKDATKQQNKTLNHILANFEHGKHVKESLDN